VTDKLSCSDCESKCKREEPCDFFIKDDHLDGWCSGCKKVMKWCSECGGYHHENIGMGVGDHGAKTTWERNINKDSKPLMVDGEAEGTYTDNYEGDNDDREYDDREDDNRDDDRDGYRDDEA
jgi:hypothetical protein